MFGAGCGLAATDVCPQLPRNQDLLASDGVRSVSSTTSAQGMLQRLLRGSLFLPGLRCAGILFSGAPFPWHENDPCCRYMKVFLSSSFSFNHSILHTTFCSLESTYAVYFVCVCICCYPNGVIVFITDTSMLYTSKNLPREGPG